MKIKKKKN